MRCCCAHGLLPAGASSPGPRRAAVDHQTLPADAELQRQSAGMGAAIEPGSCRDTGIDEDDRASRLKSLKAALRRGEARLPSRVGTPQNHVDLEALLRLRAVEKGKTAIPVLKQAERGAHGFDCDLQFAGRFMPCCMKHRFDVDEIAQY